MDAIQLKRVEEIRIQRKKAWSEVNVNKYTKDNTVPYILIDNDRIAELNSEGMTTRTLSLLQKLPS